MMIAILKGKVRSERGARRVTSKAKQANSIAPYILPLPGCQLLVFDDISSRHKVVFSLDGVWPSIALFSAQSGRMVRLRHAGRMALRCQRGAVFFSSSGCKCLRKRCGVIFDDAAKFYPLREARAGSGDHTPSAISLCLRVTFVRRNMAIAA